MLLLLMVLSVSIAVAAATLFSRQWTPQSPPRIVFGTLYEKGGDAFTVRVGEPYYFGLFEASGGWWLEEEGGDCVSHCVVVGGVRGCCCCVICCADFAFVTRKTFYASDDRKMKAAVDWIVSK